MRSPTHGAAPWVTVPRLDPGTLDRPRLRRILDAACTSASVVAITAGPGYGKSTLLAGWARTRPRLRVAWVDCRVAVRSPGGLWQAVRLAIEQALPDPVATPAATDPLSHDLYRLFAVASLEQPLVLVLDDLHEVVDEATLESLDLLLDYLPEGLTLVMSSRWDPPLHLARLRARGRVTDLRAPDLALDGRETTALLVSRGITLDEEQRQRVVATTQAWPVAVNLAARALADAAADDRAAVLDGLGSDRGVVDYLVSEVLGGLDPAWYPVIVDVSIVERFCPMLVRELSAVADADTLIAGVAARTGLLSPSIGSPGWWEMHPLARAHLGAQLAAEGRQRTRELHTRAARWFAGQGTLAPALEHAIRADDRDVLEEIVEHLGIDPLLRMNDDTATIATLITRADPCRFTSTRSLALAVALLAAHDPRTAAAHCAPLRERRPTDPRIGRLRAVAIARVERTTPVGDDGFVARTEPSRDDASAAELLLVRAEQALSPPPGSSFREVRDGLAAELAAAESLGADRVSLELRVALGWLALITGESRAARRYAAEALGSGRRFEGQLVRPLAEARLVGTSASLDLGDDVARWMRWTPSSTRVLAGSAPWMLVAAAIEASTPSGRADDLQVRLDRLGEILDDVELTWADRGLLAAVLDVELRLAGAMQNTHRIERVVARLPASWSGCAEGSYLRAQAHRLLRSDAAARRELHPVVHGHLEPDWPAMRLRVLALDGMLAHRCGAAGLRSLDAAVDLAARTGRLGPFIALGGDMYEALLSRRVVIRSHVAFVDDLLARMAGSASPPALAEPLTSAEHTTLRRLDSMATLEEIALGLHVSRNTVKTHTAAIYRKLGVGSRRAALARAQQLRLL